MQDATLDLEIERVTTHTMGDAQPCGIHRSVCGGIDRRIPGPHPCELFQPEIGAGIQSHHLHAGFDLRNERHEQPAIEPAFIEIVRCDIGRRNHHRSKFEQSFEQSSEDHGIGDVGDMKFVEAKQPRILEDRCRREPDRINSDGGV